MPSRRKNRAAWDDRAGDVADYGDYDGPDESAYADAGEYANDYPYEGDDERGLILQTEQSLVGVSSTVTHHGAPLLSYTRTMNRFYANRRQRLSLGRHKCEVCGGRIRLWAWETPNGNRTHDACYERLAWTWTNLYAQQQQLASQGQLD
ncbi:MAG TPA: hypothetical protein VF808_02400 [Ktedonobacterales bacterium]